MSGRFMSVKRGAISAVACMTMLSQLVGCAAQTSTEMMERLNNGSDIEITMAAPDDEAQAKGQQQAYHWEQLDRLITYDTEFRTLFDEAFHVTEVTENGASGKYGCMYVNEAGKVDGNTTLRDSLRNKVFMTKYMADAAVTEKMAELAQKLYVDVDKADSDAGYAAINAYYNLFSESKDDGVYFNAKQSVSREDFYGLMYRAENGVSDLENDPEFDRQVGAADESTAFAARVDEYAWLNAENHGLRPGNYKESITRAEAIYLLVQRNFKSEFDKIKVEEIKLADAKDGGDMLTTGKEKLQVTVQDKDNKETTTTADGWQLGVLAKMQAGTEGEVCTDMYKALGVAEKLGIIGSQTEWNRPLSKTDAIDFIVKTNKALNERDGYLTEVEYGTTAGTVELPTVSYDESDYERPPADAVRNAAGYTAEQQAAIDKFVADPVLQEYMMEIIKQDDYAGVLLDEMVSVFIDLIDPNAQPVTQTPTQQAPTQQAPTQQAPVQTQPDVQAPSVPAQGYDPSGSMSGSASDQAAFEAIGGSNAQISITEYSPDTVMPEMH